MRTCLASWNMALLLLRGKSSPSRSAASILFTVPSLERYEGRGKGRAMEDHAGSSLSTSANMPSRSFSKSSLLLCRRLPISLTMASFSSS